MKLALSILLVVVAVVVTEVTSSVVSIDDLDRQFLDFKKQFNKTYANQGDELKAKQNFAESLRYVLEHNEQAEQGVHTFTTGINEFSDMSTEEFHQTYLITDEAFLAERPEPTAYEPEFMVDAAAAAAVPDSIDWTTKGVVTHVKNQGQCGSCWAFAAAATIEAQHALKTGKLISVSDQNMLDCSVSVNNQGCNGGWVTRAYQYVKENHGVDDEHSYPYKGRKNACTFRRAATAATIKDYVLLNNRGEEHMKQVVATVGPVAVIIDASPNSFKHYKSGILREPNCHNRVNHFVTVVGYGTKDGIPYWKVKNSWGEHYGQQGYIYMARNFNNMCSISIEVMYPIL